jgi:hypothetical protein
MPEGEIIVGSGISWIYDKLRAVAQERLDILTEGIAEGVPLHEYGAMVGRRKEAKRWVDFVLQEIFTEFQQAEESSLDDDGLEEMPGD